MSTMKQLQKVKESTQLKGKKAHVLCVMFDPRAVAVAPDSISDVSAESHV